MAVVSFFQLGEFAMHLYACLLVCLEISIAVLGRLMLLFWAFLFWVYGRFSGWISEIIDRGMRLWAKLSLLLCQNVQKIASILTGDELISRYRLVSILRNFSSQFQSKAMAGENERVRNVVVYVTVPNKETGRNLARSIVNAKLAACVNQIPGVESTYWWEGKVSTDSEELLIIKTRDSLLNALNEYVKSQHPYEVPEVIALPIIGGNPAYLKWLEESTKAE